MFANTSAKGQSMCFPDTCKTPAPPAPPVPIPYPNIAMQPDGDPSVDFVLIEKKPAHNLKTEVKKSSGDNAGTAGGLVSGKFMGPCKAQQGSMVLQLDGKPATKSMGPTGQNGSMQNAPGTTLVPSQTLVMVMA